MSDCSINYDKISCKSPYSKLNKYNLPGYWKPNQHTSSIIYQAYFYPFYQKPYSVSNYYTPHDFTYDPKMKPVRNLIKDNNAIVEGFITNNNNNWYLIIITLILIFFIFI